MARIRFRVSRIRTTRITICSFDTVMHDLNMDRLTEVFVKIYTKPTIITFHNQGASHGGQLEKERRLCRSDYKIRENWLTPIYHALIIYSSFVPCSLCTKHTHLI